MRGPRSRRIALLVVALVAVGAGIAVYATGVLNRVEHSSVDARFDVRGDRKPNPDIVIVEVDDTRSTTCSGAGPSPARSTPRSSGAWPPLAPAPSATTSSSPSPPP